MVGRWEGAAALAPDETRTVVFRTGIVVGHGGAMQRVGTLTRFGLSGRLGTGGQHWPWIALDDEVSAIVHLLSSELSGPVNVVGPTPATADRVMSAMSERMHRPYTFTVPERMLGLALGRADSTVTCSKRKPSSSSRCGRTFWLDSRSSSAARPSASPSMRSGTVNV